jgi:DNA modification methylase
VSTPISHCFKTVYFPRERTRAKSSARVTLSLPTEAEKKGGNGFGAFLRGMSSRDIRLSLGDPVLEDLETQAAQEGRSLSNLCARLLLRHFETRIEGASQKAQLSLPWAPVLKGMDDVSGAREPSLDVGVTFRESHRLGANGWYPFVEGFSAPYVRDALLRGGRRPHSVYDPFGGAGTVQLTASCLQIPSSYSEVNPFMAFVADTKVTSASWARNHYEVFARKADEFIRALAPKRLSAIAAAVDTASIDNTFPERQFFEAIHLGELLAARQIALSLTDGDPEVRSLFLLACAANVVRSSNMTRRADLRRRRDDEYKTRVVDVSAFVVESVKRMLRDIEALPPRMSPSTKVSSDCRELPAELTSSFEFAITSPPYLNGTNYFRNTKLELWFLGLINSEDDLARFHRASIAGGINSVVKARKPEFVYDFVEGVAVRLDETASDLRIPALVRQYFADMQKVLAGVYRVLTPGGRFLLDIGDSKFYGVHVPTDVFLAKIAEEVGFVVEHRNVLAKRYSRDKSALVQTELVFQKPRVVSARKGLDRSGDADLATRIASFSSLLPYKQPPFNSRAWGHKLHSLCSYQGKLKPALAHWLVREFVPSGGRLLDPLGGVGTIPFEAAQAGVFAVSNDKSPLAAVVAAAKLSPPDHASVATALEELSQEMSLVKLTSRDFESCRFGLNGAVTDFYHPDTLQEVLRARRVFRERGWSTPTQAFVWAALLHVLHGNRPYALSRISHPITPFHPKGPAVYKSVIERVRARVRLVLETPQSESFVRGCGLHGDFRELPGRGLDEFDAIVTSPPFYGMRFDRPNWLRMWFCGWEETDFHKKSLTFLEREQVRSTECYEAFFDVCRRMLRPTGLLVVHLGSSGKRNMAEDLKNLARRSFRLLADVTEDVQGIEQHGIRDKGLTTRHHLLFLIPA